MSEDVRRLELAKFLRRQRERISPDRVEMRSKSRRKVAGLRRDEVAEFADISVTWYTWLEQGRPINVSPQALGRIATALQCTDDERSYLFQLAGESPPPRQSLPSPPPANLQQILDALSPNPAYMMCSRFDILAWNESAAAVFGDFARYPEDARNLLWLLLTDATMQERFVEWERSARCILAHFRGAYAKAPGEKKWIDLVAALHRVSPQFRTWWNLHEVAQPQDWPKELRHVEGNLTLNPITMRIGVDSDLSIVAYTPAAGTDSAARLGNILDKFRNETHQLSVVTGKRHKAA